ncbi:MAG: 4Fe-4S binding protein [Lachnospiraceae bacterium]
MATDYTALKKGGFMRQKQKDNFSLRLQVVGGTLTVENIKKIAEVAEKYGAGHIHLTSRQGVEIPFIKLADIEEVKEELAKGDCRPGVCGPRVRTVTACQGNQICPSGNIDTYKIAKEIDKRYYARELPHKFKFGVTGCLNNCLKAEENDVGVKGGMEVRWKEDACILCGVCVKACREGAISIQDKKLTVDTAKCNFCGRCAKACPTDAWDTKNIYLLSFGGLFGNTINRGEELLPPIESEEQLFRVTDAAIEFFEEFGKPSERFKFTLDRAGKDVFKKKLEEAYYDRA